MDLLEYVKKVPGHKNSKGELAPWTIVSHETGKIISSHKSKKAAEDHLKWMEIYSRKKKWTKTESVDIGSIEPGRRNLLFIESIAKLGIDEPQLEAIIQMHNAIYPEMAIDEGVVDTLKNVGKAALVAGALALGTPGNADAANNDNSAISRQTPTEQVMQQDQEGAKLFAEQIKQLNGAPYAIGKGVSKNASMASQKAMVDANVKANSIAKGDGSASSFKTGVNGDVKIIAQKNLRDKDGKWVSYALCSFN